MVIRAAGQTKNNISLIVASVSALMSLGGVAFAAGVLNTRVEGLQERVNANRDDITRFNAVPERLARIEADVSFLRQTAERRENAEEARLR